MNRLFSLNLCLTPCVRRLSQSRTPGFIPVNIWRQQRDSKFEVQRLIFPDQTGPRISFSSTKGNVSLSGKPVEEGSEFILPSTFSDFSPTDQRIIDNLNIMKIENMSPIQQYTASILTENEIIEGEEVIRYGKHDLLGSSQTGSGKTLAYLFPLMNNLLLNYPKNAMDSLQKSDYACQYPSVLVLAPTRELAQQIFKISTQLAYRTYLRTVCLYGGEKPYRQANEIRKGLHVAICTPGRLLQFLNERELSLKNCQYLVLDEADRMLDMGFEPQLREIIENPKFQMPSKSNKRADLRQTALFSATFPKSVTKIARDFLRGDRCVSVNVSYENQDSVVPKWGQNLTKEQLSNLSRIPQEVTQKVVVFETEDNLDRYSKTSFGSFIVQLIEDNSEAVGNDGQILIFTNTRSQADAIDRILYKNGYLSSALHGTKTQVLRNQIIEKFRKGILKVLVATSVAARGLDFPNVRMVINAGIPTNEDDYVHRVGRTGRFGTPGVAVTIFNPQAIPEPSPSVAKEIIQLIQDREGDKAEIPEEFIRFSKKQEIPQVRNTFKKRRPSFNQYSHKAYNRTY